MATKDIIKEIPTDFDKDLVLTPSAPVPSDIGSGLPAVLEDLAKRELDKPMTRRELFRGAKRAVQIGGGAALDRSKIGDWIIGDDTISSGIEGLTKDLLGVNEDVSKKMDEIYEILPIATRQDWEKISKEMGSDLLEGLDYMSTELWHPHTNEDSWSEAHSIEGDIEDILSGHLHGPITEEARDKLNKVLPIVTSLRETVDKRTDVLFDLYDQIQQDYPEIYDIEPDIFYDSTESRASHIQHAITQWVANKTWAGEDEEILKELIEKGEWVPEVSDVIKKAVKDYPETVEATHGYGLRKKKESEEKARRLIESTVDLARRLAAPPTGTQPRKPPVQESRPAQPKIPAPRATMEQPPEQGRGLSNIARMLPAVGKRLPFVAPAAALLRSRPAGVDADIVPPDPLGTGRVYRNYHDYNPRNI